MKNDETPLKSRPGTARRLRIRDLEVDPTSGTVWRDGEVIDLPDLSFRLLMTLVAHAPEQVSKDDLIREVWGDVVVSDETLAQRARLLRQALGDDGNNPRYFTAVRGRGYRLTAPVEKARASEENANPRRLSRPGVAGIVTLVAVLVLGAVVFWSGSGKQTAIDRLAVLPFDDMSRDGDYGFFADGMHEELLARLARIGEIDVLSRTSVERFRSSDLSVPEIAEALEVDAVIEGSVRVSGNDLRLTVQLIDGRTDRHLWVENYDRVLSVENIFEIQRRVADEIAGALRLDLGRGARATLPTSSLEAYNRYLLGRYHTSRQTPESLANAVDNLEAAIALDPEFAEAYAALGWALAFQGTDYGTRRPREVLPLAREAALEALALDDTLSDAHSLYADILTWYDWDFELAESEHRRAIALNPRNLLSYMLFLSTQARHDEAIQLVERALASAPEDPFVNVNAAWRYLNAGRYEDAVLTARAADGHPDSASVLGRALLATDDLESAVRVFEEDLDRQGRGPTQLANLAQAYYRSGRTGDGDALLAELEALDKQRYLPSVPLAAVLLEAGDVEAAYRRLAQAIEMRERGVIFLAVSRTFAPLADEERFQALLRRVGLPAD